MARLAAVGKGLLLFALTLHLHHKFHGPAIDYVGLAMAAAASSVGVPGPGEPVLIAAAIFAARHDLDITSVVVVAWIGATVGGMIGWAVGWKAGRALVTARGPFKRLRLRVLERGERVFERWTVLAVVIAPAWVAGIHQVRSGVYVPANALSALLWAAPLGLGAYFAGPPVIDLVDDAGTASLLVVGGLLLVVVVEEIVRRRRTRHGRAVES